MKTEGKNAGSALIGQAWDGRDGAPDPHWFQGRPSHSGYNPLSTGSSQLGASAPQLAQHVQAAKRQVAKFNTVPESQVPKEAVTGSSSAIDPDISPAYARLQADRVARVNRLPSTAVHELVDRHTTPRAAGFLGEPHVNVLRLNIAVHQLTKH